GRAVAGPAGAGRGLSALRLGRGRVRPVAGAARGLAAEERRARSGPVAGLRGQARRRQTVRPRGAPTHTTRIPPMAFPTTASGLPYEARVPGHGPAAAPGRNVTGRRP